MPGVAFCFSAVIIFMFVTGNFLFPCNRIFPLGNYRIDSDSADNPVHYHLLVSGSSQIVERHP